MAVEQKQAQVVVIGSGPGGYAAAFRAADLGKQVILVERYANIGGVCLNVGCIPSKTLLHAAKVIDDARDMAKHGVSFADPTIDIDAIRDNKVAVVKRLTGGLAMMAKRRKVEVVTGVAGFTGSHTLRVEGAAAIEITFEHAIIAVGSRPVKLPFLPEDERIFDSTGALALPGTSGNMLVIGGGIIGLEMATVYRALGCQVTVVEMMDQIAVGCDIDLVKPLQKRMTDQGVTFLLSTRVESADARDDGVYVRFVGDAAPDDEVGFDRVLVAVGRCSNADGINAEAAGLTITDRRFIAVNDQMRSSVDHIFAIGDVVGQPMLAHKATYEGRLAAEVIAGKPHHNDAKCIPSVAYTDPEIAWVGLTETEAKANGVTYHKSVFPWMASGRALSNGRSEGMTKLLFDDAHRVIGGGIVGTGAGDLISEIALAIEMGADATDLALTIHPHPTLSESVMIAAEIHEGTATDF